jgi:hypothetical protein
VKLGMNQNPPPLQVCAEALCICPRNMFPLGELNDICGSLHSTFGRIRT